VNLNIDRDWLLRMAEKDGNGIISVGGLVARIIREERLTMSQRIRESFDSYLDRIGLADAGPEEVRELRRAFFAGCWEVLCAFETPEDSDVEEESERVFRLLKAMRAECEKFNWRVFEGKD
jgi:hypothetical protein